jgi:methionyl-tRNA synthetase
MPSPSRADGARPAVVIAGPPTSNGDLHVGHVAGPFVGADVHVRYLRGTGRKVVFVSCGDDSQTYVVTAAARLGTTPAELARSSWPQIKGTFEAMGIALDGFAPTDDGYRSAVYDYAGRLYANGKFRLRTVPLHYSQRTGKFLVEGLVGGECPTCLADSRGGFCEACGHPIDFGQLRDPYSVLDRSDQVTLREAEIMVFPMEEYREQLIAYAEARAGTWRPHPMVLMREVLARPLPDYPITYPVEWGLPAPFTQTPGQTLNAWFEGMPACMYSTAYAQRQMGIEPRCYDEAWRAENNARIVVFMGFDPLYVWGLVHVAEMMAHQGRYVLPDTMVCNEFYDLDNEKFSTSKGHLIWARDLVAEVPRDVVRFCLNLTAPEHARASFSRSALDKLAARRLVLPWNEMATALAKLSSEVGEGQALPVSPEAREFAAAIVNRFGPCFELATFSLSRGAELVAQNIERLRARAQALLASDLDRDQLRACVGDLFLQVRALISGASPVLIDLAASAAKAGRFELQMSATAYDVPATTAFAVPQLSLATAPACDEDPAGTALARV